MEFSSLVFLFTFLPIFLILHFSLRPRARNGFLLLTSLLFYFWGEGVFVLLLLLSIGLNYLIGLWLRRRADGTGRRSVFLLGVGLNLAILGVFKYAAFFIGNINGVLKILGLPPLQAGEVHLPIGISFITFQTLSYLIDVYQKRAPAERNLRDFSLYVALFPKLITGPITPFRNLAPQLSRRRITPDGFTLGVGRFIIGLGKKVLLADKLAPMVSQVFELPAGTHTAGLAWLGILGFALQIYFDFAGYSDMAIGLGRMCGFEFPENFNHPYMARSIRDFWTRWHISLAQWLRDYLFLPIAYATLRRIPSRRRLGVKAEDWAYHIAAFTTMTLCGLWHGASWNFVFWGAFFGIFLMVEHAGLEKRMKRLWLPLRILYAQVLVTVAWVFFRSPDFAYAFSYLKSMFGLQAGRGDLYYPALYLNVEVAAVLVLGMIAATPAFNALFARFGRRPLLLHGRAPIRLAQSLALVLLLVWSVAAICNGTFQPFIYFRF